MLWTKVGLFVAFALLMAAMVAVNMHLAYRFRPLFRMTPSDASVDRYRDAVTPIRGWLLAGVGIVVGIFAGTSAVGQWRTFQAVAQRRAVRPSGPVLPQGHRLLPLRACPGGTSSSTS
ncbi:COG1615 family transporter [Nocardioides sp. W3-2-3]|nr:COG1615 family transporter [Nocardioides convexus]